MPRVGRRVGVVSTSGGAGVWLADACDDRGLEVPDLGDALRARITAAAPTVRRSGNPLDLTGRVIRDANVATTVRAFAEDPDIDVVVLSTSLSDPLVLAREADGFAELMAECDTPLLVLTYTQPSQASIDLLADLGIAWATSPVRVARMVDHLVTAGRGAQPVTVGTVPDGPPASSFARDGQTMVTEPDAKQLLRAWGVHVPPGELATTADAATRIAQALGGPVAMKVVSIDLAHKSDVQGVALDVDPARAGVVFRELIERVPQGVDGVLVERMADAGHEMIVGVLHDETFGPIVMIGAGGIYAELLGDVRFVPLPVDHAAAVRAIHGLRVSSVLRARATGARPISTRSPTSSSASAAIRSARRRHRTRPQSGCRARRG